MSMVENDGVYIHYEVEGSGPPLVLYHGMGDSIISWREYGYTETLKKQFELVLIDGRGHGASDKPHHPDAYTLPLRVSDVVAVLDDLDIDSAHYLGYSLGGWTGLGMARYAPQRLQSLIIGGAQPYGQSMEMFREVLRSGIGAWVNVAEQMAGPLSLEQRRRLLRNDAWALLAGVTRDRPDISDSLQQFNLPSLLFAGEADPLFNLVQRCAEDLPDAQFLSLPGLNHFQTVLRSDLLLPHIAAFLSKVSKADFRSSLFQEEALIGTGY